MAAARPLIAGNWKMNGLRASLAEIDAVKAGDRWRDLRRGDLPAGDAHRGRRAGAPPVRR